VAEGRRGVKKLTVKPCMCAHPCIIAKKLKKSIASVHMLHGRAFKSESFLQKCTTVCFLELLHGRVSPIFRRL